MSIQVYCLTCLCLGGLLSLVLFLLGHRSVRSVWSGAFYLIHEDGSTTDISRWAGKVLVNKPVSSIALPKGRQGAEPCVCLSQGEQGHVLAVDIRKERWRNCEWGLRSDISRELTASEKLGEKKGNIVVMLFPEVLDGVKSIVTCQITYSGRTRMLQFDFRPIRRSP